MILVRDTEQTLHGTRSDMRPGWVLCGFPPRKRDGTRWLMSDGPANDGPFKGSPDDVTCVWCRAVM